MQIILIGNYPLDKQESMERFAKMMQAGFQKVGITTEIWRPLIVTAFNTKSTFGGIGKWLGYIDKWLIFPLIIKWRIFNRGLNNAQVFFHVCDHSNSFYLNQLPVNKAITCHDVIAIRAAFGHADAHNPTSKLGVHFQKWILSNIGKAERLAAVSQLSFNQVSELVSDSVNSKVNWEVIHNAFNDEFYRMSAEKAELLLLKIGIKKEERFILHIGSDLPRKNRKLLVDMLIELGDKYDGYVCFAGHAIDGDLLEYIKTFNLLHRIKNIISPDHDTLVALYSSCDVFIFPSFSEGFGWPITEAQACGAVVITSNIPPMPEVSGNVALYADPYDPKCFADKFLKLRDERLRAELVAKGYRNADNFKVETMINKYLELFKIIV